MGVAWHWWTLRHSWVRTLYLLLLGEIGLVLLRLLSGHVVVWKTLLRLWRHAASSSLYLCVRIVFGRVDCRFSVDAILITTGRFWRVQASLVLVSVCINAMRFGCATTYLDQILALGLRNQRLKLGSSEGVHETGFGDDEEENLGPGKDREFIGLAARRDR
jgi:hypothetical protein